MPELASKRLLEPCRPLLTAFCPTMDLVATVAKKQVVDVWRFNGQLVFGLPVQDDENHSVEAIAWRFDGRMLAVTLTGSVTILIDSYTGKIAHRLSTTMKAPVSPPHWSTESTVAGSALNDPKAGGSLTWSAHLTDRNTIQAQLSEVAQQADQYKLFGTDIANSLALPGRPDLPRALAGIDVEASLPKLSTLPPTGADTDVFSNRTAVDAMFHANMTGAGRGTGSGKVVDALLTCLNPNKIYLRLFDSFEVGAIDLVQALPKDLKLSKVLSHASHPLLFDHYLIVQADSGSKSARRSEGQVTNKTSHLLRIELKFLQKTSQHLPLLAAKATQLQNLLRYLQQIQTQMSAEVRTAFDLPNRFVGNINESLGEDDRSANFKTAAYQLVVTGECPPRLREWLVDEVGERGLKRWEKAVGDCLDMIRRMTSECLLPAVERCQVVLSRLEGLARFEDTASRLGLDDKHIGPARETLDACTLLCEDMLRDVCTEIREFGAFMRWLRWEAEVEALEEDSERAEEMRESFSGEAELRTVLDYLDGPIDQSRVLAYIEARSQGAAEADDASLADGDVQFYANYKKARRERSDTHPSPKLHALIDRLRKTTEVLFQHIAETLRKSILVSHVAAIPTSGGRVECQIMAPSAERQEFALHILSGRSTAQPSVSYTVANLVERPQQKQLPLRTRNLSIPGIVEVLDFKFIDEAGFVVLASTSADRQILWHPVSGTWTEDGEADTKWEVRETFVGGQMSGGMKAGTLAVNRRNDKQAVVVSDESAMGFAVFSLEKVP